MARRVGKIGYLFWANPIHRSGRPLSRAAHLPRVVWAGLVGPVRLFFLFSISVSFFLFFPFPFLFSVPFCFLFCFVSFFIFIFVQI
jgi:hypothetical protein